MKRRTVNIGLLVEQANEMFLNSEDDMKQGRQMLAVFIENILLKHGQYNGFNYLSDHEMKKSTQGTTVGIRWKGNPLTPDFENTDHTRVKYYWKG